MPKNTAKATDPSGQNRAPHPSQDRQVSKEKLTLIATSPSGMVKIEKDDNRLRIRFTYQGKRYAFALGLPYSKVNQAFAVAKATQIELDITSGHFDFTLQTYKPLKHKNEQCQIVSLVELKLNQKFNRADYALLCRLKKWNKPIYSPAEAQELVSWLKIGSKGELKPASLRRYLATLKQLLPDLFGEIKITVPNRRNCRAYTSQQVNSMLLFLQKNSHYNYYHDFVKFLFLTGCRTGEAIGLTWGQVDFNRREIKFDRSLCRDRAGVIRVKTTKTEEERYFPMNRELELLLRSRYQQTYLKNALVFPSPQGGYIDSHNFSNRCWRACLTAAGIDHQPYITTQYKSRHTLISHALEAGVDPVAMAEIAGHGVDTLYEFYASSIHRVELPSLYRENS